MTAQQTLIGCGILLWSCASLAEPDAWPVFNARPVLGYARFADSFLDGNLGNPNRIRTKKEDVVGGIAASFNYSWRDWRTEIEYAWRARTDANGYLYSDSQSIGIRNNLQNQTLTANLRRYGPMFRGMTPYVAAGYGKVRHESVAEYLDIDDKASLETGTRVQSQPTWNAGAGMQITTSSGWLIDLGYRYVDLGRAMSPRFASGLAFSTGELVSHDVYFAIARAH